MQAMFSFVVGSEGDTVAGISRHHAARVVNSVRLKFGRSFRCAARVVSSYGLVFLPYICSTAVSSSLLFSQSMLT